GELVVVWAVQDAQPRAERWPGGIEGQACLNGIDGVAVLAQREQCLGQQELRHRLIGRGFGGLAKPEGGTARFSGGERVLADRHVPGAFGKRVPGRLDPGRRGRRLGSWRRQLFRSRRRNWFEFRLRLDRNRRLLLLFHLLLLTLAFAARADADYSFGRLVVAV